MRIAHTMHRLRPSGLEVGDVRAMVGEIRARGGTIQREPKAMNAGAAVIAFVPRSAELRRSFCPQPA